MKRSVFNVPHIFALEPLFFEKNGIKRIQTDRHTIGSFSQFKLSPLNWNQTERHIIGSFSQFKSFPIGNFHYYIRNQRVKIRKYGEFDGNRKFHLFGTAPLIGFSSFFSLNLIFLENNGFRAKMHRTLKIDLFIRHNFCEKYFFLRSIFIDIK